MFLHNIRHTILLMAVLVFSYEALASSINDPTKPIYSNNAEAKKTFRPVVKSHKELTLQSIFFSKDKKIVVINSEILREGDLIEDVVIADIHEDYVTVKYKKTTAKLVLSKKLYLDESTGEVSD